MAALAVSCQAAFRGLLGVLQSLSVGQQFRHNSRIELFFSSFPVDAREVYFGAVTGLPRANATASWCWVRFCSLTVLWDPAV